MKNREPEICILCTAIFSAALLIGGARSEECLLSQVRAYLQELSGFVPENGFCVPLLNRSIQDHSDHGASKKPKNPCSYHFSKTKAIRQSQEPKATFATLLVTSRA